MSKNVRCSECRHQMTGWDGGFFGEPMTCECRIYGVTKGLKGCSKFKKRVTKSDLLNKIQSLENQVDEQQATINKLTKNKDRWRELAELHNGYFNCLEKAIEKAYEEKPYPKIEDIMTIYSKLEKEINDE